MNPRSKPPKDDGDGKKEPKGGGAGNHPKEKRPAQGYGRSPRAKGPGRRPGDGKGKGGKGGKH